MLHDIYCLPIGATIGYLLLFGAAWTALGGRLCARGDRMYRRWRMGCAAVLAVWLCAVLYSTLLDRTAGSYAVHPAPLSQLRAVLRGDNPEILRSWWMNVLLFVPCGMALPELLPRTWSRKRRVLTAVLAALLLSAGVELAQWRWQLGQAETDDGLANVLGGLLGSGIFALRCRASARLLRRGEDASGHT